MSITSKPVVQRRLIRVGPGLVLAILASIAVWAFMPRQPSRSTILPSSAALAPVAASAPDPHWLFHQARALGLTPAQASKLGRLVARWDRDTESLRGSLQSEAEAFQKGMADRAGKPANVQQVKQDAAPMASLSRQMADARRAWWADARTVLTPDQRAMAETAWANQWSGRGLANEESR